MVCQFYDTWVVREEKQQRANLAHWDFLGLIYLFIYLVVRVINIPHSSGMLGKHSTTELDPLLV
jgi:hypothetical protein